MKTQCLLRYMQLMFLISQIAWLCTLMFHDQLHDFLRGFLEGVTVVGLMITAICLFAYKKRTCVAS